MFRRTGGRRRSHTRDSPPRLRMDAYRSGRRSTSRSNRGRAKELDSVMKKARRGGSQSNYWNKRLLEVEEKDPNRWRHSGYKELYHDDKRSKSGSRSRSGSLSRSGSVRSGRSRSRSGSRRSRSMSGSRRSMSRGRSGSRRSGSRSRRSLSRGKRSNSRSRSIVSRSRRSLSRGRRSLSRGRRSISPRSSVSRSPVSRSFSRSKSPIGARTPPSRPRSPRPRSPLPRTPRPRSPPSPPPKGRGRRPPSPESYSSSSSCSDESCSVCSRKGRPPPRKMPRPPPSRSRSRSFSPPPPDRRMPRRPMPVPMDRERAMRQMRGPPFIKVESDSESSGSGGGTNGGPKLSLSERFGKMAQWSVDRGDFEHRNLRITSGDRLTVEMDSPPYLSTLAEYGSWNDVRTRYAYYKEQGWLRDLTLQDYLRWEQWWYKYQDWLDGNYPPRGGGYRRDR